jgi:hypothetical protein
MVISWLIDVLADRGYDIPILRSLAFQQNQGWKSNF